MAAAKRSPLKLWREAGVRILPGGYLAHDQADGSNPGADFIRVAMVQDQASHGRGAASHRRHARLTNDTELIRWTP